MRSIALVLIGAACAAACARPRPRPHSPAPARAESATAEPAPARPEERAEPSDPDGEPELCSLPSTPLDEDGRAMLVDLEQYLAAEVLGSKPRADRLFNIEDVHKLLRKYTAAEMVFVFPAAIPLPASSFRARIAASMAGLRHASHMVFYLELSDVEQVVSGSRRALVLHFGAGPTGTPPKGTVWLWGLWAQYCVVRGPGGGWSAYPLGPVMVSLAP